MTITALAGPGRVAQFLWGANQQSTLTFGYPLLLDNPRFWRAPRPGSEQVLFNDRADSWTTGRDFYAALTIRWAQLPAWSGGAGVQAFLDWGAGGGAFALVPDAAAAPLYAVPGCLLLAPFDAVVPALETNGAQMIDLVLRNPTYDLGLAWR